MGADFFMNPPRCDECRRVECVCEMLADRERLRRLRAFVGDDPWWRNAESLLQADTKADVIRGHLRKLLGEAP